MWPSLLAQTVKRLPTMWETRLTDFTFTFCPYPSDLMAAWSSPRPDPPRSPSSPALLANTVTSLPHPLTSTTGAPGRTAPQEGVLTHAALQLLLIQLQTANSQETSRLWSINTINKYTRIICYFVKKMIQIQSRLHIMAYKMASCFQSILFSVFSHVPPPTSLMI